ncbi:hypothetical protein S245_000048, partial [Arachis hypogaea]
MLSVVDLVSCGCRCFRTAFMSPLMCVDPKPAIALPPGFSPPRIECRGHIEHIQRDYESRDHSNCDQNRAGRSNRRPEQIFM